MKENKISADQSTKIQAVRGLAIIAVVIIHCTPDFSMPVEVFLKPFVNFAVGTFLFLSGLLSNVTMWKPLKRIKKILIPYVIWTLIYTAINYGITSGIKGFVLRYIKYFVLGTGATMLYFVFVYCEFTLLIPVIDHMANSRYYMLGFAITPIEIISFRLLPLIMRWEVHPYIKTLMRISCLGWFSYFYLGYLLGNSVLRLAITTEELYKALIISVVMQMMEGYAYYLLGDKGAGSQMKLTAVLTGCIFCIIMFYFIKNKVALMYRLTKIFEQIGNCSFGMFFNHIAVFRFVQAILAFDIRTLFPINALFIIILSFLLVRIIQILLGPYSKFLAC